MAWEISKQCNGSSNSHSVCSSSVALAGVTLAACWLDMAWGLASNTASYCCCGSRAGDSSNGHGICSSNST